MPYKNIIFTKLQCELATDERFTDRLDDDGKLVYFCLLLLMGVKENKIPSDEKWLKRTLNLSLKEEKIREKLEEILKAFPKTICQNGFIKFKNYNKMHNPLGKSEGNPKDKLGMEQIQIQIQIIKEYIRIKKLPVYFEDGNKDKELEQHIFKRNAKTAKDLVLISHNDFKKVAEVMEWFGGICDNKGLSWSLETILKWYPEYLVKGKTHNYEELLKSFGLKKGVKMELEHIEIKGMSFALQKDIPFEKWIHERFGQSIKDFLGLKFPERRKVFLRWKWGFSNNDSNEAVEAGEKQTLRMTEDWPCDDLSDPYQYYVDSKRQFRDRCAVIQEMIGLTDIVPTEETRKVAHYFSGSFVKD